MIRDKLLLFGFAFWIALGLILVLNGCATAGAQSPAPDPMDIIHLMVENHTYDDLTIYTTPDGNMTSRLGDCSALQTCMFTLSRAASAHALSIGSLQIGFRPFNHPNPRRGPTAYATTPAFRGMLATLTVNFINNFMTPYGDRKA